MYAAHKVHESYTAWQPWMLDLVPEYGVMPDRMRHMLDAFGTRFPFDDRKYVLRLDQSKPGMKEGYLLGVAQGSHDDGSRETCVTGTLCPGLGH